MKILLSIGLTLCMVLSVTATPPEMDTTELFSKIEKVDFDSTQYVNEVTEKTQICLHHTVSGATVKGDIRTWEKSKARIATCVIVSPDGKINQLFSSKKWGYHLGIKKHVFASRLIPYQRLDKTAIGSEFDSWGGLKYIDGEWRCAPNKFGTGDRLDKNGNPVKTVYTKGEANMQFYSNGYRGYEAFEKYTEEHLYSTKLLLEYWNHIYGIPLDYNPDMWDVSENALRGEPGIWSHTSYRADKSDCHPQPELIRMLKSLT